jgi:hypothetical protein
MVSSPSSHPAFNPQIDGPVIPPGTSVFLFPLFNKDSDIVAILEIARAAAFGEPETQFADWFNKKFKLVQRWCNPVKPIDSLAAIVQGISEYSAFYKMVFKKVAVDFECRECEIWQYDQCLLRLIPTRN